ncbi:MAG: hypothetical protein ACXWN9_08070, partial [Candidatus Binataceae bacterium]
MTGVWFDAKVVGVIAAVVIFTLGIAFAQFQAWQEMWREKSRLQKIVNGSGLVFRCGDGPPY